MIIDSKWFKAAAWGYLGTSLSMFGHLTWLDWRFYAILIPFIILINLGDK